MQRGAVTKSQKKKKACIERKVGAATSGKQRDSVLKETHVVSVKIQHLATDARFRDEKDNRPLPHPTQFDGQD